MSVPWSHNKAGECNQVEGGTITHAEAAALLRWQRQPADEVQHGGPVDCAQGFVAAQADQGCCGCIGGRQMRQLPGAAPKSTICCLAGPQEIDDICVQKQPCLRGRPWWLTTGLQPAQGSSGKL